MLPVDSRTNTAVPARRPQAWQRHSGARFDSSVCSPLCRRCTRGPGTGWAGLGALRGPGDTPGRPGARSRMHLAYRGWKQAGRLSAQPCSRLHGPAARSRLTCSSSGGPLAPSAGRRGPPRTGRAGRKCNGIQSLLPSGRCRRKPHQLAAFEPPGRRTAAARGGWARPVLARREQNPHRSADTAAGRQRLRLGSSQVVADVRRGCTPP